MATEKLDNTNSLKKLKDWSWHFLLSLISHTNKTTGKIPYYRWQLVKNLLQASKQKLLRVDCVLRYIDIYSRQKIATTMIWNTSAASYNDLDSVIYDDLNRWLSQVRTHDPDKICPRFWSEAIANRMMLSPIMEVRKWIKLVNVL